MYCTRSDIEDRFGKTNVAIWADLDSADNSEPASEQAIAARIDRAIATASARIDDAFRTSRYVVPLQAVAGASLTGITDVAVSFAGVWLYESRGIDEQDEDGRPFNRLHVHRKSAERQLLRYLAGQDDLPAVVKSQAQGPRAPFVV